MARSAVGGVAHSSGLPWANALAMTIYVTSNPAYFYNCSFISFSFIASKRERNVSKEREKRDQMIRVIRGFAPEPLLCHPELVSASLYNEIPKQVRNDNIRKFVGRFGNVVSDNSNRLIKRVFLFRFNFFFLRRNQKEKVNKEKIGYSSLS